MSLNQRQTFHDARFNQPPFWTQNSTSFSNSLLCPFATTESFTDTTERKKKHNFTKQNDESKQDSRPVNRLVNRITSKPYIIDSRGTVSDSKGCLVELSDIEEDDITRTETRSIDRSVDRPVDKSSNKNNTFFSCSVDSTNNNSSQWTINSVTGRPIKVGGRVDKYQRRHSDLTDSTTPTAKRFKY